MVASDPPTDLSADANPQVLSEVGLVWRAPKDDGGSPITGYKIERNEDGGSFSIIAADTGNTNTTFTDDTAIGKKTYGYKISAINGDGTSSPSNVATTTTSSSEAQTIAQLLFSNWLLTGELAKTVTGDMTEVVHFFDRGQVPGNKFAKAITVQKINELGNENIVEHPKFFEQSDTFEITCFMQVPDSADAVFSTWIDLMQQMTSEVIRILKTVYSPSSNTGEFFRTTTGWTRDDTFFPDDPELTRTLRFTLTRILSNDEEVFIGYGGVLVFDTLASQGDMNPMEDYTFAQVTNIDLEEGYTQIPILTKDTTKGVGVPQLVRGMFSGTFRAVMFAKKDDIIGDTIEKLQNIYKTQLTSPIIHQNAEVVFLQTNPNTQDTPVILNTTSFMKIDNITKKDEDEQLLSYIVHGTLTRPTTYGVTNG